MTRLKGIRHPQCTILKATELNKNVYTEWEDFPECHYPMQHANLIHWVRLKVSFFGKQTSPKGKLDYLQFRVLNTMADSHPGQPTVKHVSWQATATQLSASPLKYE